MIAHVRGGLGGWCWYVEKGKTKDDQLELLKDVPDKYRNQVISHMRTVIALENNNNEKP